MHASAARRLQQRGRHLQVSDIDAGADPKLVAAAFGMNPEGVMIYLADHVDQGHLAGLPVPDKEAR
jgi:hypothetical protein